MKRVYILVWMMILFSAFYTIKEHLKQPKALESITFFPIATNVTFKTASTSLNLTGQKILWRIHSTLDRQAYLRQDAGLLYSNGRLIGTLADWKQHTDSLSQTKAIPALENALWQAITFHHAELHEKVEDIFSAQRMTQDQLYVIKQTSDSYIGFHTPKTAAQNRWKTNLDEQTRRMMQYSLNKGVRHYRIHLDEYDVYPLDVFSKIASNHFPGFNKEETAMFIGRLWEGLYKNYLLGIKKQDGTIIDPKGSTLPLILIAKDKTHLLVLTETAKGEPILLRQMIEGVD